LVTSKVLFRAEQKNLHMTQNTAAATTNFTIFFWDPVQIHIRDVNHH